MRSLDNFNTLLWFALSGAETRLATRSRSNNAEKLSKNIASTHTLTIFTKHSMLVSKEVCYGPPEFYWCADNLGSVILVMVPSFNCYMQLHSTCWKKLNSV